MEINLSQIEGQTPITVMHLHGSVDSTSYQVFQEQALEVITQGARNMVIDLHDVPYMSSAGLRALNQLYNKLRDENVSHEVVSAEIAKGTYKSPHLKLAAPNPRVMETLKMSGFDMFLEIHPNVQSAVNSFQAA